ncbi:hypothetical protein C8F04DRAFT_1178503 [Mycena alexandri]|uniref:Uncharacterized protein n=1 Tax=Mycena alexandri TaxID=1745969 RepID=A0AAD6T5G4_9AGAR|nr:hypothetical protein C8F04DRAFT_1178503 [Mycena alexandri]
MNLFQDCVENGAENEVTMCKEVVEVKERNNIYIYLCRHLQKVERAMTDPSGGSPPTTPTPLDATTVKDIESRFAAAKTRPQLMEALGKKVRLNTIKDVKTARQYLVESGWMAKGAVATRAVIFEILLKVSILPQTLQKLMPDTVRAVAFLAETVDEAVADELSTAVAEALGPELGTMQELQRTMSAQMQVMADQVAEMKEALEEGGRAADTVAAGSEEAATDVQAMRVQVADLRRRVEATSEEMKEGVREMAAQMAKQVGELKVVVSAASDAATTAADGVQAAVAAVAEVQAATKTATASMGEAQTASRVAPTGPRSYAAAASTMTAEQAGVLARAARMRRQILIDKAADTVTSSLGTLSVLELKEKANIALSLMTEKLEGAAFVGARKLDNGGVVFDCADEKTADWVKEEETMKDEGEWRQENERRREGQGTGRLAGGVAGQGGGGVDAGWASRREFVQRAAEGANRWSKDGLQQSYISDAFNRQTQAAARGRGGVGRGGRGAGPGPSALRNEVGGTSRWDGVHAPGIPSLEETQEEFRRRDEQTRREAEERRVHEQRKGEMVERANAAAKVAAGAAGEPNAQRELEEARRDLAAAKAAMANMMNKDPAAAVDEAS